MGMIVAAIFLMAFSGFDARGDQGQKSLSLGAYLEQTDESWFLTGKKEYTIQAMMVSGALPFHNALEDVDYVAMDDGETVVLRGTRGEMWTSPLSKVVTRYTKPDGSELRREDFAQRDVMELPHNTAAHLAAPFPPVISCRFFDLPPVNLQNLQERLTENSLAS